MKKVAQIRYYGDDEGSKNSLNGLTQENFNEELEKYQNIQQIGIQSFPGAIFRLNDGEDPIYIGATGIYELNIQNLIDINRLIIDDKTLEQINNSNGSLYIIIDILYEEVDE